MIEWLTASLILIGALFSLLAALGVIRMPDFYTRLQTATKGVTLGVGCLVVAAAIHYEPTGTTAHALLVLAFLTLTAPVSAQLLARAAYAESVPLWEDSVVDEMNNSSHPPPSELEEGPPPNPDE